MSRFGCQVHPSGCGHLWKGNGDRWECSSHRSITLLSIPVIVERRREFRHGLLSAYIDHKKAFDIVHRESLREKLRLRGISIRYTGIESAVECGEGLMSFFPVSLGMRLCCVLAPTLFNTFMDWILGRAAVQSHCRIALASIKVTDLDFADVAILPESYETLVVVLDAFIN
ncbi:uncharacterized protein [Penaeus vannamei]|uniref:uncharacterized protein n=1 Tax=Penaeus vannamei TaxID=6689 RepID=UPI00387F7128